MKKFLVIMGSPRKGNTYEACEELRGKLEKDMQIEFEYLWLKDMNLLQCQGCFNCFCKNETTCPNRDDVPLIEQKMLESDCIIFASPVYVLNVTGLMKTFMDRFGYFSHRPRPRFFDTKAFILITTAGGGLNSVQKYINRIIRVWGFEVVGKIGLLTPPDPNSMSPSHLKDSDSILSKAAAVISRSFRNNHRKSPGLYEICFFHARRAISSILEKYYPYDYQYWKEKGWYSPGLKYYVNVPINQVYVTIAGIAGCIIKRIIRQ